MVIPMKYEDANVFSDGLASVKLGGKWGFVDSKGKEVIALQYEDAKHFEEGYAAAKQNGKWGVINKENKLIVGFIYDEIIWIKNDANEIRIKKETNILMWTGRE
ncbi:MAG: WG repeat-containing protein [Chitinophagaceae bacterium]|nr:WG repeat-containing protein [Chitinophagaceae bacterium]